MAKGNALGTCLRARRQQVRPEETDISANYYLRLVEDGHAAHRQQSPT